MEYYDVRTKPLALCCLSFSSNGDFTQASRIFSKLVTKDWNSTLVNGWTTLFVE